MCQKRHCTINIQFGIDFSKISTILQTIKGGFFLKPEFHERESWININEEISNNI